MKRILIVAYDMLPYAKTWGGCQRMYYLAKRLERLHYSVDVAALRTSGYNDYGKPLLHNVSFLNARAEDGRNSPAPAVHSGDAGKSKGALASLTRWLKRSVFTFDKLWFNEIKKGDGILTYREFVKARSGLIAMLRKNRYDVAICSGPPFNVFRSIPLIRKYCPGTKIIMDYRDPWNSWHEGNRLASNREKSYEKMADIIVCTNAALCEDLSRRFDIPSRKFRVVANGFAGNVPANTTHPSNDKLTITYTGAISFSESPSEYRDTSQIIAALGHFKEQGINDFRVVFVGAANNDEAYVKKLKEEFGEMIEILSPVSIDEAGRYTRESDVCLLLHTSEDNSGKFLISGKAYDYIRDRKFILSIGMAENQHARLVEGTGIGINALNHADAIIAAIDKLRISHKEGDFYSAYDNVDVSSFSRDNQIDNYIKIIDSI